MSDSKIAGDFLSLLAERKLLPGDAAPAHGAPVQTQATTVFAFHYAEGVLMAGDRRATAGNVIVTDRVEKIIEVDSTSLLAVAGVPATAFEMARVLQTSFEYYRRSQLQPLSLPARVRALARLLRDNLPMTLQGVGVVVPLFAGVDHNVSPPQARIYFYDPLGAQFQDAARAAVEAPANTRACARSRVMRLLQNEPCSYYIDWEIIGIEGGHALHLLNPFDPGPREAEKWMQFLTEPAAGPPPPARRTNGIR